jgi:hypothetical protein
MIYWGFDGNFVWCGYMMRSISGGVGMMVGGDGLYD